jgi:enoyl-CoA hydratase
VTAGDAPAGAAVLSGEVDGVLVISINRPQVRNAINAAVANLIAEALDELDADERLAAAVLTGVGGTFCAGMDLKAFLAGERPVVPGRGFAGIAERSAEKPVLAAVEGHAVAGGCEVALACDMIVASEDARFGLPEVTRGLIAAGGGLLRLPQRIPRALAFELALTGETIGAARALEIGLVNRVVPAGQAREAAIEIARRIAGNAPLAVRATKRIIAESADWPASEAFERQREIAEPVRESLDAREGARAFAEKRQPVWQGR